MTGNGMQAKPSLARSLLAVALATAALLAVPFTAMRFTSEVNWTISDFVIAGILLSLTGLAITLALRQFRDKRGRLVAVGLIVLGLLYCWAELAVGIFTGLGS